MRPEEVHRDAVETVHAWRDEERVKFAERQQDMARRNLHLLAERLRFPAGALEVCIRIEDDYPYWWAFWHAESTTPGFERPACFSASRRAPIGRDVTVYAADEVGLREQIENTPDEYWPSFRPLQR